MPISKTGIPESTTDPEPVLEEVVIYAKDVAGNTELFARTSDGTITPLTPKQSVVVSMGNFSVGAAADTRFLDRWNAETTAPIGATGPVIAPRNGVLKNMYVRHQAAVGNGNNVRYTVHINGAVTLLSVVLPTGVIIQGQDLVNQVPVLAGDRITIEILKLLPIGNGQIIPSISMEYT